MIKYIIPLVLLIAACAGPKADFTFVENEESGVLYTYCGAPVALQIVTNKGPWRVWLKDPAFNTRVKLFRAWAKKDGNFGYEIDVAPNSCTTT